MPNIGFFDIPADDVDRAKEFYTALLGWTIEPVPDFPDPGQHRHTIVTGPHAEGTVNAGGLYQRHGSTGIMNFVIVPDLDVVLVHVEKLGGRVILPRTGIENVGFFAVMQDTEGNILGLLQRPS